MWRANELVTGSRGLLEEVGVLTARNSFARRGVDEQANTLHAIRDGVAEVGDSAVAEFKATLAAIDKAHGRLEVTLDALRKTVVDASLQRTGSADTHVAYKQEEGSEEARSVEGREQKTLYDFVQESTQIDIEASIRGLVDEFQETKGTLDDDLERFDDALRQIAETLQDGTVTGSGPQDKRTIYDEPAPTIPQLFRGMEDHASEMAKLLESLINHYDLCVSALKHTEGGGEAARLAVQAEHLSAQNSAGAEESLYRKTAPEPISDSERDQMLRVLQADAQEVEDVLAEIKDHSAEIETLYESLTHQTLTARTTAASLRTVLTLLHEFQTTLPVHLASSKSFRASWSSIQTSITAKTEDLASLATFYDDFSASYAKVVREVERRKTAETQMRKLAAKAQRDLDKLVEADKDAREEFMDDVRMSLPRDIWPGANNEGVRWEVRPVQ